MIAVDFGGKPSAAPNLDVVEAEVTETINLNSSRSDKETVHLELAFDGKVLADQLAFPTSPVLGPNQTYSYTFMKSGSFGYRSRGRTHDLVANGIDRARSGSASFDRLASHGCVRLEDANRLGRWLLGQEPVAPSSDPEQNVQLAQGVPVYIAYLTAKPEGGKVTFSKLDIDHDK